MTHHEHGKPRGELYPATLHVNLSTMALRVVSGSPSPGRDSLVLGQLDGRTIFIDRMVGSESELLAQVQRKMDEQPSLWDHPTHRPSSLTTTVAICTLGKHPRLLESVQAILRQTTVPDEIIIVDNAPASGTTRHSLAPINDPRVTIVDEERPGLSHARNRAVVHCTTDIIAFTDDDTIADSYWIGALLQPFAIPEVACVTGLVIPAELRTEAQREFEAYVGFSKGLSPLWWGPSNAGDKEALGSPGPRGPLFPWTTGKIGSGNSMAFRTSVLDQIGNFDTALGAGTIAQGGEDLDMFRRLLLADHVLAYTPDAIVWHYHREELSQLKRQVRANGIGMSALLVKSIVNDPSVAFTVGRRSLTVGRVALRSRGRMADGQVEHGGLPSAHRRSLLIQECIGLAQGPFKYVASKFRTR